MRTARFSRPSRLLSVSTTRRMALAGTAAMAVVGGNRVTAQSDVMETQAGTAMPGENAIEFVAAIRQHGPTFRLAGYLTALGGVNGSFLFDDVNPLFRSEATARIAITGTGASTARSVLGNLVTVNLASTIQLVLLDAGATFDDPASFGNGTIIATARSAFQNVIANLPPGAGASTGSGTMEIESNDPFELDGEPFTIGEPGLRYRMTFTGQVESENPAIQEITILAAGNGVVAQ